MCTNIDGLNHPPSQGKDQKVQAGTTPPTKLTKDMAGQPLAKVMSAQNRCLSRPQLICPISLSRHPHQPPPLPQEKSKRERKGKTGSGKRQERMMVGPRKRR